MPHLLPALSTSEVQGAQFVNDYTNHPDYRLVAAFCLGWTFLSGLRHVCFSDFLRELMWTLNGIANRLRGRAVTSELFPQQKPGDAHRRSLEPRDGLVLLLCMGFMLAGLASFLSLLTFDPNASGGACTFVIAASSIATQIARIFGLLILIHDLKNRLERPWELRVFLALLALGTALSGITVAIGSGQLVTPMASNVAMCFRRRFLPTSLGSSIVNFTLELYIIIRSLSLMRPPRLRPRIVRDAGIIQAGSLLFFDLLIVVPNTTFTSLVAEFIPYSIGALGVLAAFNSSFGQTHLGPTQSGGPNLNSNSRDPRNAVRAQGASFRQGNTSNRIFNIDNPPYSGPNWDIEAQISSLRDPRDMRRVHTHPPSDRFYAEASSARLVQASGPTIAYDSMTPATQLQPPNRLRREKILSYSSPIWATFGAPRRDEDTEESTRPEMTIEVEGSSTTSVISHSHERDTNVLRSSSILGSDIIRATSSNERKNRMRVPRSATGPTLSLTASIPGPSRRATRQSLQSRLSAYPSTDDDISLPVSLIPKSAEWLTRRTSSLGKRSKSSGSSKSQKSSSSMRSAKAAATAPTEESPSVAPTAWIGMSARVSRTFSPSSRGNRASFVRGPRPPPPSPMRMWNPRLSGS